MYRNVKSVNLAQKCALLGVLPSRSRWGIRSDAHYVGFRSHYFCRTSPRYETEVAVGSGEVFAIYKRFEVPVVGFAILGNFNIQSIIVFFLRFCVWLLRISTCYSFVVDSVV